MMESTVALVLNYNPNPKQEAEPLFVQLLQDVYLCNTLGYRHSKNELVKNFTNFMFEPRDKNTNPFLLAP
jgi:hypothetical protein